MTKSSILTGALAVLLAAAPTLAAAQQTVALPRPKPEISAAQSAAIAAAPDSAAGEAGTAAGEQPAGAATLDVVLALSDTEIIDRYGIGSNLSHDAELIVAVTAATSNINTACRDRESLRTAMEPVVQGLKNVGKIQGKLWPKAFEAGKYMYVNCGQMVSSAAVD